MDEFIAFRIFQPRFWQDDEGVALTVAPQQAKPARRELRRAKWASCLAVPLLSVGVSVAHVAIRVPETAAISRHAAVAATDPSQQVTLAAGEVPADYWPRLLRHMNTMRTVAEPDSPDPEPEW